VTAVETFAECYARMRSVSHQTVWIDAHATRTKINENTRVLIFYTENLDTAAKAHKALEDAGVLCDLDLGSVHDGKVFRELKDLT